ncbi:hypothetical protein GGF39_003914 [Coemansia sp. RSA 1721]|nr:hypothetical protein GGF39_003914 [Coemansia sp. RSA 1721]
MQFAKLSVSLFALAAIGAASPAPQAQTLIRIGHAGTEAVPESSSSIESPVDSSSSQDEGSPVPEESPAEVSSDDEDSLDNSPEENTSEGNTDDATTSKTDNQVSSDEDGELSDDEEGDQTSTLIISEDQTVSGERSESDDDDDSKSSGADSFRGASVITLAVAGGVSLMLAAF